MKLFYCFSMVLLLFSCQEENEYLVEDTLYQCIINDFNSRGISFEVEINKLESALIEEKILQSSLPNDYLRLQNLLNTRTEKSFKKLKFNSREFKKLSTFFQNRIAKDVCLSEIDSITKSKSRFYTVLMSVSKKGSFFELSLTDYKHNYYRVNLLLTVLMFNLMQ